MDNRTLKKTIILLLLLNKNKAFTNAYSLIKVLSRWFNIIDFNELIQEMQNENLVIHVVVNQVGNYTLTEKGKLDFKKKQIIFEQEIKTVYPNQLETINVLFSNLDV